MLSLSVVMLLLLGATGVAVRAKFSRRSLFASVGVLEALGVLLLGLPGGAFLETLEPVMERMGAGPMSPDGAWPAAIMMSVLWPVALAPAYLVGRSVHLSDWQRGLVTLAVLMPTCALLGAVTYMVAA